MSNFSKLAHAKIARDVKNEEKTPLSTLLTVSDSSSSLEMEQGEDFKDFDVEKDLEPESEPRKKQKDKPIFMFNLNYSKMYVVFLLFLLGIFILLLLSVAIFQGVRIALYQIQEGGQTQRQLAPTFFSLTQSQSQSSDQVDYKTKSNINLYLAQPGAHNKYKSGHQHLNLMQHPVDFQSMDKRDSDTGDGNDGQTQTQKGGVETIDDIFTFTGLKLLNRFMQSVTVSNPVQSSPQMTMKNKNVNIKQQKQQFGKLKKKQSFGKFKIHSSVRIKVATWNIYNWHDENYKYRNLPNNDLSNQIDAQAWPRQLEFIKNMNADVIAFQEAQFLPEDEEFGNFQYNAFGKTYISAAYLYKSKFEEDMKNLGYTEFFYCTALQSADNEPKALLENVLAIKGGKSDYLDYYGKVQRKEIEVVRDFRKSISSEGKENRCTVMAILKVNKIQKHLKNSSHSQKYKGMINKTKGNAYQSRNKNKNRLIQNRQLSPDEPDSISSKSTSLKYQAQTLLAVGTAHLDFLSELEAKKQITKALMLLKRKSKKWNVPNQIFFGDFNHEDNAKGYYNGEQGNFLNQVRNRSTFKFEHDQLFLPNGTGKHQKKEIDQIWWKGLDLKRVSQRWSGTGAVTVRAVEGTYVRDRKDGKPNPSDHMAIQQQFFLR